ncbi:ATP phosphoribosyltransferase regulatory subunit [soil metagenome]
MLPPEAMRLNDAQSKVISRFRAHGFREVITPALEYAEVIDEPRLRDASFKLFDPDNQMLLLRPEMTTPIARLVAQRLTGLPTPHKLSYCLPVYRRSSVGRGQSAEFHQAGVEVVGSASPGEDAGAISLLIDTLETLGLRAGEDFRIVLGQAAFYRGYIEENAPDAATELLAALAGKDLVRVEEISRELPEEVAAGVRAIPRIVGPADDGEVLETAEKYAVGEAKVAFENLRGILGHIEASGRLGAVMLDFGLIGRHGYYTGAVYEAYAAGLGFTIANGGRYDTLLEDFGESLPATGFAISLERLVSILAHEPDAAVLVLAGSGASATKTADDLRADGLSVLHVAEDMPPERAFEYANSIGAGWVAYPAEGGVKMAKAGDGQFENVSMDEVGKKLG